MGLVPSGSQLHAAYGQLSNMKLTAGVSSRLPTPWLMCVLTVQAAVQPPTFVMFVNDTKLIDEQYKTYLSRQLRDNIDLTGTPIRLLFRGKPPSTDRRKPMSRDDD